MIATYLGHSDMTKPGSTGSLTVALDHRYITLANSKLIREYTWGSSLKVSGEGESKKNWNFAKLTCLLIVIVIRHA